MKVRARCRDRSFMWLALLAASPIFNAGAIWEICVTSIRRQTRFYVVIYFVYRSVMLNVFMYFFFTFTNTAFVDNPSGFINL